MDVKIVPSFKCILFQSNFSNFKTFKIDKKNFIKFDGVFSFKLILHKIKITSPDKIIINYDKVNDIPIPVNSSKTIEVNHELPVTFNLKRGKDNKNIIIDNCPITINIGNKKFTYNKSFELKYIHVREYEDGLKGTTINFSVESKYKSIEVTRRVNIPFYIKMNNKVRVAVGTNAGSDDFLQKLQQVEKQIESYTREEICGVIESLFN